MTRNIIKYDAGIGFASHGSFWVSATCYRRAENVRVIAVVVAEFEFRYAKRQTVRNGGDRRWPKRDRTTGAIRVLGSRKLDSAMSLNKKRPLAALYFANRII